MSRDGHLKDIEQNKCDMRHDAMHSENPGSSSHSWNVSYQDCTSLGSLVSFLLKREQIIVSSRNQKENKKIFGNQNK